MSTEKEGFGLAELPREGKHYEINPRTGRVFRTLLHCTEESPDGVPMGADGAKLDAGKSPVATGALHYFPRALEAVAIVSEEGIAKGYAPGSWRSVQNGYARYTDALGRHLCREGYEEYDAGTGGIGVLHAAQVAWNALARLELLLSNGKPVKKENK